MYQHETMWKIYEIAMKNMCKHERNNQQRKQAMYKQYEGINNDGCGVNEMSSKKKHMKQIRDNEESERAK